MTPALASATKVLQQKNEAKKVALEKAETKRAHYSSLKIASAQSNMILSVKKNALSDLKHSDKMGFLFASDALKAKVADAEQNFSAERAFNAFDDDKNGFLDRSELKNAIATVNEKLVTEKELDEIMSQFDTNSDGKLSLEEFTKLCDDDRLKLKKRLSKSRFGFKKVPVSTEEEQEAVEKIKESSIQREMKAVVSKETEQWKMKVFMSEKKVEEAKEELVESARAVCIADAEVKRQKKVVEDIKKGDWSAERIFAAFDKDRNGYLDIEELELALPALLGVKVSRQDAERLSRKYDENNDGHIDFEEFQKISLDTDGSATVYVKNMFSFKGDDEGSHQDDAREKIQQLEAS